MLLARLRLPFRNYLAPGRELTDLTIRLVVSLALLLSIIVVIRLVLLAVLTNWSMFRLATIRNLARLRRVCSVVLSLVLIFCSTGIGSGLIMAMCVFRSASAEVILSLTNLLLMIIVCMVGINVVCSDMVLLMACIMRCLCAGALFSRCCGCKLAVIMSVLKVSIRLPVKSSKFLVRLEDIVGSFSRY